MPANEASILWDRMLVNMSENEWDAVVKVAHRISAGSMVSMRFQLGRTA